ncbi:Fungal lipase-like domain containing protein [Trema orientale]|uniref:Fungal lipase-like domain containing protein n=1 Tax=Trema orientale TaxID=63057 RepID=A0A2P5DY94_TREOI|nr:Fungal lipase-like domain containing protein [Trema orientale]
MATKPGQSNGYDVAENGLRYLIVRPEKGGLGDLFRYAVTGNVVSGLTFLESSDDGVLDEEAPDYRWVIIVSIIVRKIIAVFGKPMEWVGYLVDFVLNLLSLNGNLVGLLYNILRGKVVLPRRGTETFISTIGQLDGRIDLYKGESFAREVGGSVFAEGAGVEVKMEMGNRALMDLCIMASKLAYENAKVVNNIVMHFVDFYDCWNDFQKERSTQVFILCDKPKDANLILISFRGTEPFDADDWSTDFDYSWYEIPKLGKVHMGFLEALGLGNRTDTVTFQNNLLGSHGESNSDDVIRSPSKGTKPLQPAMVEMTAYYAVRSKLKSLLKEHKNAKFVVTGHSLGGALAILFPTVLVLHEERELMQKLLGVYTFGQPRIGDKQLGKIMEAQLNSPVPRYFRVVYCNDLVPRLPYDDKTFLYHHFGVCLYYDSFYVEQKVKEEPNKNFFGLRNALAMHVNAVWELVRSFIMGYVYGPEYEEGWFNTLARLIGLALPGISAHCPTDYVNSVRLGRERSLQMSSF